MFFCILFYVCVSKHVYNKAVHYIMDNSVIPKLFESTWKQLNILSSEEEWRGKHGHIGILQNRWIYYWEKELLCIPENSLVQLDLWVSLIKFICKLLCMGMVITQCDKVNLQLKWAICFVSQCKTNTVNLKTQMQHWDLL